MWLTPADGKAETIEFAFKGFFVDGASSEELTGINDFARGAGVSDVGDPSAGELLLGDDREAAA